MLRFVKRLVRNWKRWQRDEAGYIVACSDHGFTVSSVLHGRDIAVVRWDDVRAIRALKRDCFSYDVVCLAFQIGDNDWVEVSEDMPGFDTLATPMREKFASIPESWRHDVTYPPFELNDALLYKRGPDDGWWPDDGEIHVEPLSLNAGRFALATLFAAAANTCVLLWFPGTTKLAFVVIPCIAGPLAGSRVQSPPLVGATAVGVGYLAAAVAAWTLAGLPNLSGGDLLGFGLALPLQAMFGALAALVFSGLLHAGAPLAPRCPQCGYSLTRNVSGQCPECGWPVGVKPRD